MILTITDYRKRIKENMSTEDKNILIARFMGCTFKHVSLTMPDDSAKLAEIVYGLLAFVPTWRKRVGTTLAGTKWRAVEYLEFHSSWGWLMPVVEHILDLELDEGRFYNRFCEEMASGSGIDGVYAAVVEAIEYINENE